MLVKKIIATVAIPAEVAELVPGLGEGVVLLTTVTITKQIDIRSAAIQSVGLRPHLSVKNRMYVVTVMNFWAPNKPVMRRFWLPPPTSNLKNWGAK